MAPAAILILFAMIAYGLIFTLHLSLQHLLAETGRSTIPGLASGERIALARDYFEANMEGYVFLDPSSAELEIRDEDGFTEVRITYRIETHPAYVFQGLLPLPDGPFVYRQSIRNGGG